MPARHNACPHDTVQADAHFVCPEESDFFALCIEHFIFQTPPPETIVEFGSGDGGPVLHALQRVFFSGTVYGYEINPLSAALAQTKIAAAGQTARYQVTNTSFFTAAPVRGQCLSPPPRIYRPSKRGEGACRESGEVQTGQMYCGDCSTPIATRSCSCCPASPTPWPCSNTVCNRAIISRTIY